MTPHTRGEAQVPRKMWAHHVISHLRNILALVAVPRTLAGEDAGVFRGVQQAADGVDAGAEQDVHLHDTERRGDLVLHDLYHAAGTKRETRIAQTKHCIQSTFSGTTAEG